MNIINKKLFALMFLTLGALNAAIPAKSTLFYRVGDLLVVQNRSPKSLEIINLEKLSKEFQVKIGEIYEKRSQDASRRFDESKSMEQMQKDVDKWQQRVDQDINELKKSYPDFEKARAICIQKFQNILKKISKDLDASAVMPIIDYEGIPLYIDPEFDITDRAIEMLNKQYLLECKKR